MSFLDLWPIQTPEEWVQKKQNLRFFIVFPLFFHGFFKELDFKELEIHRYSLLDTINEYQWISINEFIDGPSMYMVPPTPPHIFCRPPASPIIHGKSMENPWDPWVPMGTHRAHSLIAS